MDRHGQAECGPQRKCAKLELGGELCWLISSPWRHVDSAYLIGGLFVGVPAAIILLVVLAGKNASSDSQLRRGACPGLGIDNNLLPELRQAFGRTGGRLHVVG